MIPKSIVTEEDNAVITSIPASMIKVSAGISIAPTVSPSAVPAELFIAEISIVFSTR